LFKEIFNWQPCGGWVRGGGRGRERQLGNEFVVVCVARGLGLVQQVPDFIGESMGEVVVCQELLEEGLVSGKVSDEFGDCALVLLVG